MNLALLNRMLHLSLVMLFALMLAPAAWAQEQPPSIPQDAPDLADRIGTSDAIAAERMKDRDSLDSVIAFVRSNPNSFADSYVEFEADGVTLTVLVARANDAAVDQMHALAGQTRQGAHVRVLTVEHSHRDLSQIQDELNQLFFDDSLGFRATGVAIDVRTNRVELSVADHVEIASNWVAKRYGEAVFVIEGELIDVACTHAISCFPMRGGIEMYGYVNGQAKSLCTWGLGARNANGNKFLVTAGHCEEYPSQSNMLFEHTSTSLGYGGMNSKDGPLCNWTDSLLIPTGTVSYERNKIRQSSTSDLYAITATKAYSGMTVGDPVKWVGSQSWPYHSGDINNLDVTYPDNDCFQGVTNTVRVYSTGTKRVTAFGDSGGPVYWSGNIFGTIARGQDTGSNKMMAFSLAEETENALNITFCHSATC